MTTQEARYLRRQYLLYGDIRLIQRAIYKALEDLAHEVNVGDTVELPNGCTMVVTFKPGERKVH